MPKLIDSGRPRWTRSWADLAPQTLGDHVRRVLVGARKDQRELLTADPRRAVDRALGGGDQLAELLEGTVALAVAEEVVDDLEVIEVADDEADRLAAAARAAELVDHELLEAAPVEQAGERVGSRRLAEARDQTVRALAQHVGQGADDGDRAHRHQPAGGGRAAGRRQDAQHSGVTDPHEHEVPARGGAAEEEEAVEPDPHVHQRVCRRRHAGEVDRPGDQQRAEAQRERDPDVTGRQATGPDDHDDGAEQGDHRHRGHGPRPDAGVGRQQQGEQRQQASSSEQRAQRAPAHLVLAHALDCRRVGSSPDAAW